MKELCSCNCCSKPHAGYVTPWCSLLNGQDDSCAVLHLWYKIPMIQDEIDKRSSYLGKFRRTEEAQHLLDLIRLSKDEENMFIPMAKAAQADVFDVLFPNMPRHEKAYWWDEGKETAEFTDNPLPSPAVTFHAGQYVKYNNDLYKAIEDGSSDDFAGKLVPTEDYRNSMHYGILWRCKSNINAVEPLDVAIFETLVARIIYKWLEYAYPDEAARFLNQYNEGLAAIRKRANILDGPQIAHRIPRMF